MSDDRVPDRPDATTRRNDDFFQFSTTGTFILSVDFCVYFAAAFWLGLSIPLFFMFSMSKFYSRLSSRQAHEVKIDKKRPL